MQPTVQMRNVWTIEDVRALDVEDWWRYEIVDGALVVSPSAGVRHEVVSARIREAVWHAVVPTAVAIGPVGVDLGRSYRVPDLVVVDEARLRDVDLDVLRPGDLRLVIEIVSPGSQTMDRLVKPAEYAAAGIRAYWRVETDPVSLTAYALPAGATAYVETGTWTSGEVACLAEPFAVEIDLARLVVG